MVSSRRDLELLVIHKMWFGNTAFVTVLDGTNIIGI
jgi:hypothetical protein